MPFPTAASRFAPVEDRLGLGDVAGLLLEPRAGDLAVIEAPPGPLGGGSGPGPLLLGAVACPARPPLGDDRLLPLGDRLSPLPGDQAEPGPEDEEERRQQARRGGVAAAPAAELLGLAGPTRQDRPVLGVPPEVLGQVGGRRVP